MTEYNPCLTTYTDATGYFCIGTRTASNQWQQAFFTSDQIDAANQYIENNREKNCYRTVTTYENKYRTLYQMLTIYENSVEIDSHIFGMAEKQATELIEELQENYSNILPVPSVVTYTGGGIHMLYKLYGKVDSVKWNITQKALNIRILEIIPKLSNCFVWVEFDSHKLGSLTRVPNTYNTAYGTYTKTIYQSDKVYTQKEIMTDYGLYTVEGRKNEKKYLKDIADLTGEDILKATRKQLNKFITYSKEYTIEKVNQYRIEDLIRLIKIRNRARWYTGYRNALINIAAEILASRTTEMNEIRQGLEYINSQFKKPIRQCEVRAWANLKLTNEAYHYPNTYIIDKLAITEAEQMQLKTIHSVKIRNKIYYNKNQDRLKAYYKAKAKEVYKPTKDRNQTARSDKIALAKELKAQGYKADTIAIILKVTRQTVYNYLNK